jgi:DNA primase large subunit
MDHVKNTHYHLACTRVFEVTKGIKKGEGLGVGGEGENVTHPNKYADASRALEK